MYYIGNIFEQIDDVPVIKSVFTDFAKIELKYRNMGEDEVIVLNDIVENCLTISTREQVGKANLDVLQLGLKKIANYIFSESYHIEKVITHASRIAYLVALLQTDSPLERYNNQRDMSNWVIEQPGNTKLNKLKKTIPEAFYYWFKYYNLL